jgi:rhamnosyl/mannosyltransferase
MKVLHVYKDYPPVYGGIENHIRTLAIEQARQDGLRVEVLVTASGRATTREVDAGVHVTRAGRQGELAQTPLSWRLARELARRRPDVTHLHVPYPMGELAQLLAGRSNHLVITYHSDVVRQQGLLRLYRPLLRRVLERAERIVVSSRPYGESSPFLRPFRTKCVVIPHGIDHARFRSPDPARVAVVRRTWPAPLVLFVGRFRYYKGLTYLLEAARSIQGTVLLVGGGPGAAALQTQVVQCGLAAKVGFAGTVDDDWLPAYFGAASVFVLPSIARSEAFGLAQVEAMAAGVPVVCTELGTGTTYVNRDGETGLVVPPRDAPALAAAVNRLLADAALRERLGAAARRRSTQQFTKEQMAARVAALYRALDA